MDEQIHSEGVRETFQHVERRAVIDVGTNSVKLLVADVGGTLKPVLKLSLQTGLGQGAFRTRCLRPEAMARTVDAVAGFAAEAASLRAGSIRVLATSATREATNGHELAQAIHSTTGLRVEVISGEQEADYVFRGVTSDPAIGPQPVLRAFGGRAVRLAGLGGALHALARLGSTPASPDSVPGNSLRREQLVEQLERLWQLSVQERRQLPGLDPRKAEVILPGAVIHEAVLNQFGFDKMLISSRGLREGTLLTPLTKADTAAASALLEPACVSPAKPKGR